MKVSQVLEAIDHWRSGNVVEFAKTVRCSNETPKQKCDSCWDKPSTSTDTCEDLCLIRTARMMDAPVQNNNEEAAETSGICDYLTKMFRIERLKNFLCRNNNQVNQAPGRVPIINVIPPEQTETEDEPNQPGPSENSKEGKKDSLKPIPPSKSEPSGTKPSSLEIMDIPLSPRKANTAYDPNCSEKHPPNSLSPYWEVPAGFKIVEKDDTEDHLDNLRDFYYDEYFSHGLN